MCGFKDVEIKGGGGISEKAKRITLKVTKPEDLNRDLFKVNIINNSSLNHQKL
jgi:zinc finger protein